MARIGIGVNMEFVRHDDKPFEWGVAKAAELGYEYVEPMVHWGRELLSEAGYFHSVSMLDDPLRIKRACQKAAIKVSGLSAHTPLVKPEIGTEYLKQAVRFAAECGAPVVNTDEGPKPSWTTEEEDFVLMRYVLHEVAAVAAASSSGSSRISSTARPRRGWSASAGWSTAPRSESTSTRGTPIWADRTPIPGWRACWAVSSTSTPRTSRSGRATKSGGR
jgi:hypothetical protein